MDKFVSLIVCMWVWNVFQISNSCWMDLVCPLLRGSSDRRLRRRAATVVNVLQIRQTVFCGGTIIDTDTVITEAHCVFDYDTKRWIGRDHGWQNHISIYKKLKILHYLKKHPTCCFCAFSRVLFFRKSKPPCCVSSILQIQDKHKFRHENFQINTVQSSEDFLAFC